MEILLAPFSLDSILRNNFVHLNGPMLFIYRSYCSEKARSNTEHRTWVHQERHNKIICKKAEIEIQIPLLNSLRFIKTLPAIRHFVILLNMFGNVTSLAFFIGPHGILEQPFIAVVFG